MTTKDRHVLTFWFDKASDVLAAKGRDVTIGEVSKHVGQSRATAKKYLARLANEGALTGTKVIFKNGTEGLVYRHVDA